MLSRLLQKSHVIIITSLVVSNVLFFGYIYSSNTDTSYVYSASEGSEYYILQSGLVSGNKQLSELVASQKLGTIKDDELMTQLSHEFKSSDEGKRLSEKVKDRVAQDYTQTFMQDLKNELNEAYTRSLFRQSQKSYSLLQELKLKYLAEHSDEIKQSIINDLLKDVSVSSDVNKLISDKISSQMDKKSYLTYLINDFIFANKPHTKRLSLSNEGNDVGGNMFREVLHPGYTKKFLTENRVELPKETFDDLQSTHDDLVKALRSLESPPVQFFNGDGIVINGGGSFIPGCLVTLIQLREMGSQLPVEIMLNDESDYDEYICNTLVPRFNATCKVIEREIGTDLYKRLNLAKFQLKTLGLILSSFDNTIALDADNLPIKNPDYLFDSEPYMRSKFLLWPDIWHKGISPLYYSIARFKINGPPTGRYGLKNDGDFSEYVKKNIDSEVMFHDLQGAPPPMGVESGQMVFSKRAHLRSLLLAFYYNYYGPSHYYKILYQGTFGVGDRETFIPALHVMNEPYYLNNYHVWFAGYEKENQVHGKTTHHLEESTLVQHDPVTSLDFFGQWESWLESKGKDPRLWPFQDNKFSRDLLDQFVKDQKDANNKFKLPEVLFLHVHKPKLNPVINMTPKILKQFDGNVYDRRFLGVPGKYTTEFGSDTDWELKFNTIARWVVCDGLSSKRFWNEIVKTNQGDVCKQISEFVEFLKKDTNSIASGELRTV